MLSLVLFTLASFAAAATTITTDSSAVVDKTFDYIVVGAGLTGITVANKLSGAGHSVLIIEAGPDARDVPAVYDAERRGELDGYCNWQYPAYDENGTALSWAVDSGACIGGGTSINGMVWDRPAPAEINMIEQLGNPGWSWNTLEPYMEAIERNHPPTLSQIVDGAAFDPAVHGYTGSLNVSFPDPMRIPEAQRLYKEALPQVFEGLVVGDDLSARISVVSASTSWTIWNDESAGIRRRSSAAYALLYAQDQQRDGLSVLAEHKVAKVLLNSSTDFTAHGVQFGNASHRTLHSVYARREVILAAGSLASPPILERSGVGDTNVLKKVGITSLVDLPGVGVNLVDQPGTASSALVSSAYTNDTALIDGRNLFAPIISLVNIDEIFATNATSIASELVSGLHSRAQKLVSAGASSSLQSALAVLGAVTNLTVEARMPVAEFICETYPSVLTAAFWPLTPLSRGWVHAASPDPFADPHIVPRMLTDEFDLNVAVAIAHRSRSLFQSAPFTSVVADAYADPSSLNADATDAEYAAWFRATSYGASHWVGSTAMLPRTLGGVVNPQLKVYGTRNLRVVDAGILPFQLTSHTMSAAYAIAQKAAELILADA
ncbi:alcohol oxidase [Phellopilus nigrolimitatus]|nr:alcohol oxidase [Phellopilus nigrolimitatus]